MSIEEDTLEALANCESVRRFQLSMQSSIQEQEQKDEIPVREGYSFSKFNNCDILVNWSESKDGLSKNFSQYDIINKAILGGYKIVVKHGVNGKWYLKGKEREIGDLKEKINANMGKSRDGVYCILIEKTEVVSASVQEQEQQQVTTSCLEVEEEKKEKEEACECPICMDTIEEDKNNITTECGHKFHASCLMKNVTMNGFNCPYCRTIMADEQNYDDEDEEEDNGDDVEYSDDESVDSVEDEAHMLRGMRWLFQRAEGEALEDDEPMPSIDFITQKMIENGMTINKLVETLVCYTSDYREYAERADRLIGEFQLIVNQIYNDFTPEQAFEQAEQERKARRREESIVIEEEYFRAIAEEEEAEYFRKIQGKEDYYRTLVSSDQEQIDFEFSQTMKKFSAKPKPIQPSIESLILNIGNLFLN